MRMRVCYFDCHEAGLCCYLVIQTYYVHYSCFTSICDVFTDSPWYIGYVFYCFGYVLLYVYCIGYVLFYVCVLLYCVVYVLLYCVVLLYSVAL
jgi:hypothetical protein